MTFFTFHFSIHFTLGKLDVFTLRYLFTLLSITFFISIFFYLLIIFIYLKLIFIITFFAKNFLFIYYIMSPHAENHDTPVVETTTDSRPEPDTFTPPIVDSPDSFPSLQLGASDIDAIVKAMVPPLADVLSKLTSEQQYVKLFTRVSKLALNKTFASDDELASLVQGISKQVADFVTVTPDCNGSCKVDKCCPPNS